MSTSTCFGLALVVATDLCASTAGMTIMPFFLQKLGMGPRDIGYAQSAYFAANAVGLFFVLPCLLRKCPPTVWGCRPECGVALPKAIIISATLCNFIMWALFATYTLESQVGYGGASKRFTDPLRRVLHFHFTFSLDLTCERGEHTA